MKRFSQVQFKSWMMAVSSISLILGASPGSALASSESPHSNEKETNETTTMALNIDNMDLVEFIKAYAKASGQRFVVDPGVHGKVSLFNPAPVNLTDAANELGAALALNGFAISKRTMSDGQTLNVVQNARNIQRSAIEVSTELPASEPERMATWIYKPKFLDADELNKRLRILPSKDGDLTPFAPGNSVIITDFVSNLHHIADILKEIDRPSTSPSSIKPKPGSAKAK